MTTPTHEPTHTPEPGPGAAGPPGGGGPVFDGWQSRHTNRMVAVIPPSHPHRPRPGDRLTIATDTPAGPRRFYTGTIVEPPFRIRYGPSKGKRAVIVQTEPPQPAEQGRAAFVARELLAASCQYYNAVAHLAYRFWQPSLFPAQEQNLILAAVDAAHDRRKLALTRRNDYINDTPQTDIPAGFWQTDQTDTLLTDQTARLIITHAPRIPSWATRWCDNICCNPAGDSQAGINPFHHRPLPPTGHIPEYTADERLLTQLTGAEAAIFRESHDLHQHIIRHPNVPAADQPALPFVAAHQHRNNIYRQTRAATDGRPHRRLTDNPAMAAAHLTIVEHLWAETGRVKTMLAALTGQQAAA